MLLNTRQKRTPKKEAKQIITNIWYPNNKVKINIILISPPPKPKLKINNIKNTPNKIRNKRKFCNMIISLCVQLKETNISNTIR